MYKHTCKVVLIGDSSVGKSCVLLQFIDRRFQPVYDLTIGVEFGSRVVTTPDKTPVRLKVWDTAGQEVFRSMTRSYYRGASVVILMYDVTRRDTLIRIVQWLQEIAGVVHPCCVLALVGNKLDLHQQRQVSTEEGQQFARKHGISLFFETSAKLDIGIDPMFRCLVEESVRVGSVVPNIDEQWQYKPIDRSTRSSCSC